MASVTQEQLDTVAARGTYTLNINPRQLLINNIGFDGFLGGGNFWAGNSATNLDDVLVHVATYPYATIALDIGTFYEHFIPVTVAEVGRLRAAFFARYGLGKPNWYPPTLNPPNQ